MPGFVWSLGSSCYDLLWANTTQKTNLHVPLLQRGKNPVLLITKISAGKRLNPHAQQLQNLPRLCISSLSCVVLNTADVMGAAPPKHGVISPLKSTCPETFVIKTFWNHFLAERRHQEHSDRTPTPAFTAPRAKQKAHIFTCGHKSHPSTHALSPMLLETDYKPAPMVRTGLGFHLLKQSLCLLPPMGILESRQQSPYHHKPKCPSAVNDFEGSTPKVLFR